MTTATIPHATPAVLDLLIAAGVRFVLNDPGSALEAERLHGKKFRPGSVKMTAHLARLKRLEEECTTKTNNATIALIECKPSKTTMRERTITPSVCGVIAQEHASASTGSVSQDQQDASAALVALNGCKPDAAARAVARAALDGVVGADALTIKAMSYLEK